MLPQAFSEFIELLEKHDIRYLIVGGYAVAAHGYPRYTGDINLFVAVGPDQASGIMKSFREFGFEDVDISEGDFLSEEMIVEIGREPLKIQVMTGISGVSFEECYSSRVEFELGGKNRPFIAYDQLLKNKMATKRGKDKVDAEELKKRRANKPVE
ncbi:MAG: hypothetical protein GVY10_06105 [Verrucomicrobia bacterium]|jgi:hypothetical protein|nr:hypothetical protein [Verrucomicrobiota bacterium]